MKAATNETLTVINKKNISIHAAREGGDIQPEFPNVAFKVFQSTPPVKAATFRNIISSRFNKISIHAAREGGDFFWNVIS